MLLLAQKRFMLFHGEKTFTVGPIPCFFLYLKEEKVEFMYLKKIQSEKLSTRTAKTCFQEMDFERKALVS